MNLNELEKKLLAAARKNPPSDQVPYAFEKRILAHLTKPAADLWHLWGKSLSRAAASCVALMLLLGVWSGRSIDSSLEDLSQDLDNAVFAAVDQPHLEDSW
ncbi:MAG: hypothetical protein M3Y82_08645 [Verrucomicrobiota bacterium]|nr:hypothetical protein [Verrucomicrobiota bacterium]